MDEVLSVRGNGGRYKRPNFPIEFKRQLAELSYEPGASVALIARQNDVNANLLFKWRHQYQAGAFGLPTKPEASAKLSPAMAPVLLPVSIVDELPVEVSTSLPTKTEVSNAKGEDGVCEIDFDHARLHIRGEVSPRVLRLLIRELSRAPQEIE